MRSFFLIVLAVVVLLLANWVVPALRDWLWKESDIRDRELVKDDGVPVWFVGNFERILAVILVAAHVSEAYTVLAAWLAAKLATSWQRLPIDTGNEQRNRQIRAGTLVALIAGVISVSFGIVAGLLFRCAFRGG
jgi:hypothetical protein